MTKGVEKILTILYRCCNLRLVMKNLTPETLSHVIDVIRPPVPEIARQLGISEAALYRYRDGSRSIPADLQPRLAAYVERRKRELEALARKLNP